MLAELKQKWGTMSSVQKASLALIFAKFCQKGITMISTPIFTRIMESDQFGIITNFNSWQEIILIFATLKLSQGVFNNGMSEFCEDRSCFTLSVLVLANLCTMVVAGFYVVFREAVITYTGLSDSLMLLMCGYMMFFPAFSYWSCRQRYEFRYKLLTVLTIWITLLQMLFSILVILHVDTQQQAVAKLYVTEFISILAGIGMYIVVAVQARFRIRFTYIKYAFRFNIFLIPHFLAMTVLVNGDKAMIAALAGNAQAAIYGVSYTAASVINTFWQAIEISWTAWLFERLNANDCKSIKKRVNQLLKGFAVISAICMLFAPEIMRILASESYLEGIYVIPSVTAASYFTIVYVLYMKLEYYSKNTKATMVGAILAAVANMILNYVFIGLFGYMAAGYTTLACYIFLYVYHYWYSRKIGMRNIYDDRWIRNLSLGIIAFSIVVTCTYSSVILRYSLIVLIAMLGIWKRKENLTHFKALRR